MTSQRIDPTDAAPDDTLPELPLEELIAAADQAQESLNTPLDAGHGRFERAEKAPAASEVPVDAPDHNKTDPPSDTADGKISKAQEAVEDETENAEEPPRKHRLWLRIPFCLLLILITLAAAFVLAADRYFSYHSRRGKEQLMLHPDNVTLDLPEESKLVAVADDGTTVTYQGQKYRLNNSLVTLLFMGIDRLSIEDVSVYGSSGQADFILLIALDVERGTAKLLNIPRDAYAEIMLYSGSGQPLGFDKRQICVAYAYGDGREKSCENMVTAVTKLLYGIPVTKYVAVDMEGMLAANKVIGGVTVTALEDIRMNDGRVFHKGDEITLIGDYCERYLRKRDKSYLSANNERMARQAQYMRAFSEKLMSKAGSDYHVVTDFYDELSPYLVSNLDTSDVIYLAQTYVQMKPHFGDPVTIESEYDLLTLDGKESTVCYLDETSLFEAILEIFYLPVE